jgi:hypothetical protein
VKEEVNREMRFEELQKLQQEIKQSVETTEADIKNLAKKTKQKISKSTKTPSKTKAKVSTPKRVKSVAK